MEKMRHWLARLEVLIRKHDFQDLVPLLMELWDADILVRLQNDGDEINEQKVRQELEARYLRWQRGE